MRLRHLYLVSLAVALSGCSSGVPITIANHSAVAVQELVLSGSGFSQSVATIAPGDSATVLIHATGESGLGVAFTANAHRVTLPEQGYFEGSGGYKVSVAINPNLSVLVRSDLSP